MYIIIFYLLFILNISSILSPWSKMLLLDIHSRVLLHLKAICMFCLFMPNLCCLCGIHLILTDHLDRNQNLCLLLLQIFCILISVEVFSCDQGRREKTQDFCTKVSSLLHTLETWNWNNLQNVYLYRTKHKGEWVLWCWQHTFF